MAITKSLLLIGEATVKMVLSSPLTFGLLTKSEIAGFINKNITKMLVHGTKNALQIVPKMVGALEKFLKIFLNLSPKNSL